MGIAKGNKAVQTTVDSNLSEITDLDYLSEALETIGSTDWATKIISALQDNTKVVVMKEII